MSNRQSRRKVPRTPRRLGLPKSNLQAMKDIPISDLSAGAFDLRAHADALDIHANPEDRRTRSVIRQLRRVAQFFDDVMQQRVE
jgi:hypothetical protein